MRSSARTIAARTRVSQWTVCTRCANQLASCWRDERSEFRPPVARQALGLQHLFGIEKLRDSIGILRCRFITAGSCKDAELVGNAFAQIAPSPFACYVGGSMMKKSESFRPHAHDFLEHDRELALAVEAAGSAHLRQRVAACQQEYSSAFDSASHNIAVG